MQWGEVLHSQDLQAQDGWMGFTVACCCSVCVGQSEPSSTMSACQPCQDLLPSLCHCDLNGNSFSCGSSCQPLPNSPSPGDGDVDMLDWPNSSNPSPDSCLLDTNEDPPPSIPKPLCDRTWSISSVSSVEKQLSDPERPTPALDPWGDTCTTPLCCDRSLQRTFTLAGSEDPDPHGCVHTNASTPIQASTNATFPDSPSLPHGDVSSSPVKPALKKAARPDQRKMKGAGRLVAVLRVASASSITHNNPTGWNTVRPTGGPAQKTPAETPRPEVRNSSTSVRPTRLTTSANVGVVRPKAPPTGRPSQPPAAPPRYKPTTTGRVGRGTDPGAAPPTGTSRMRLPSCSATIPISKLPNSSPVLNRPANASKLPVKGPGRASNTPATQASRVCPSPAVASTSVGQPRDKPSRRHTPLPRTGVSGKPVGTHTRTSSGRITSTGVRTSAVTSVAPCRTAASPLQRGSSVRAGRNSAAPVDKNKQRPGLRTQQPPPRGQQDLPSVKPKSRPQSAQSNPQDVPSVRWLEAMAVVVQHFSTQREEALRRKQELTVELCNLREELATSASSCEQLQKEKVELWEGLQRGEGLRVGLEAALHSLQEQHLEDISQLEERLREFYCAQHEELQQAYQEQAKMCRNHMQQQVDELSSQLEAQKQEMEVRHREHLEALRQQYEESFADLRRTQEHDVQTVKQTLKDAEEQIQDLVGEKSSLGEKLKAEEERRRQAENYKKDSHTLYLEQELESLKVVLDMKNKQLHQQDKKLMQMDKLVESNVKLEESMKKLQQENEDFRVRMDKHAALSRQLSSEQAILQQTLQKESKVNKRLSMENEELLWKLHNGDLSSPRKLSPSSPTLSHSPDMFPSTPLSPR